MRSGIRGWTLGHNTDLPGTPDFIFARARLAIFLDGCFWHGCRRCRSIPKANRVFWLAKIQGNKVRDRKVVRLLRGIGWNVIRIWEHELRINRDAVLRKIPANRSRTAAN
jgi:DNA mismatch endonuclease (patch repair protein)